MTLGLETFRKSSDSSSTGMNCVEAGVFAKDSWRALGALVVCVRDTKIGQRSRQEGVALPMPILRFDLPDWENVVKANDTLFKAVGKTIVTLTFNDDSTFAQVPTEDGGVYWAKSDQKVVHNFTSSEMRAWQKGVGNGEFDLPPQSAAIAAGEDTPAI